MRSDSPTRTPTPRLHTERLVLRRWQDADVDPMSRINADPDVMRWIGRGGVRTVDQTRKAIGSWERSWDEQGFGLFAVDLRTAVGPCAAGRMIGFVGLAVPDFLPEVMPAVEIGWRLDRAAWGHGLATEAARAVVGFAPGCGLDRLVSIAQVGNHASEAIMAKLGMRMVLETLDPSADRPVRVHELVLGTQAAPAAPPDQASESTQAWCSLA